MWHTRYPSFSICGKHTNQSLSSVLLSIDEPQNLPHSVPAFTNNEDLDHGRATQLYVAGRIKNVSQVIGTGSP